MKAKHQRLTLGLVAVASMLGASGLALSALRDQASFFYKPSDIRKDGLPLGHEVRLGGLVVDHSIQKLANGISIRFLVTDGTGTVPVSFTGVVPDLFRQGSGVVAEGHFLPDGAFVATNLLAKHDERYMPPQMATKLNLPAAQKS